MGMAIMLDGANPVGPGLWQVQLAPHEVTRLGPARMTQGPRSVVLAQDPTFLTPTHTLQLDLAGVAVLNLGTSNDVIIVGARSAAEGSPASTAPLTARQAFGPGDEEFLRLVDRDLRGSAGEAARNILREVRSRHPGDLKKGNRSNFSNTPDNFWYAVVQPRVQSLSITVRGHHTRFRSDIFNLKEDRPGYTRFTLKEPSEVAEALRIIEQSKRK